MAGISNRETPQKEAQERKEHPALNQSAQEPQVPDDVQTSHKAGTHSSAEKADDKR